MPLRPPILESAREDARSLRWANLETGMVGGGGPFRNDWPSWGSSLAVVPGSRVLKMEPKSWFTLTHVFSRASRFFSSSSEITCAINSRLTAVNFWFA